MLYKIDKVDQPGLHHLLCKVALIGPVPCQLVVICLSFLPIRDHMLAGLLIALLDGHSGAADEKTLSTLCGSVQIGA